MVSWAPKPYSNHYGPYITAQDTYRVWDMGIIYAWGLGLKVAFRLQGYGVVVCSGGRCWGYAL